MRFDEAGVLALDYIPSEGSYSDYFATFEDAPPTRTSEIHLNAEVQPTADVWHPLSECTYLYL